MRSLKLCFKVHSMDINHPIQIAYKLIDVTIPTPESEAHPLT